MKNNIVKARKRQGTSSLDLTLPAQINKEKNITEGDIFKVDTNEDNEGNLQIIYTLIFKNKK